MLRTTLLKRRAALIAELTQCQTQRLELERPAGEGVADEHHSRTRARTNILLVVAAVTTAALALIAFPLLPADRPAHVVTDPGSKVTRTPSSPPKPTATSSSPAASPSTVKPSPTETARKEPPPAGRDTTTDTPDNAGGGTSEGSVGSANGDSNGDSNNNSPSPSCAGDGSLFGGAAANDCPSPSPTPSANDTNVGGSDTGNGGIFGGPHGG
ncbi:hypothetical protein [Streptomyces sp. 2A115]|uniref:hypothetical protein n=1 Tax=Streptomyces sp. 2A115 TaxID=3457439 RepID=UPI003FD4BAB7